MSYLRNIRMLLFVRKISVDQMSLYWKYKENIDASTYVTVSHSGTEIKNGQVIAFENH